MSIVFVILYLLVAVLVGTAHHVADMREHGTNSPLLRGDVSVVIGLAWPISLLFAACHLYAVRIVNKS